MKRRGRKPIPHQFIDGVENKWCGKCQQYKPLAEFNLSRKCWDGLATECRQCMNAGRRVYEARLREQPRAPRTAPKRCSKCRETKPPSEFYSCVTKPDGLAAYCKPCSREYTAERAKLDRVKAVRSRWAATKGRTIIEAYQARNPTKRKAQSLLQDAVARGAVVKPDTCENCGRSERIEGHHNDYALPLEVRWLCRWCHRAWHRKHGEARNADLHARRE
jgi:hypothetical protein